MLARWILLGVICGLLSACSPALEKPEAAFWDIVVKAIGGAVALLGAGLTAATFLRDQRAATDARLEAARKPFREKQQEVFYDLLRQTSRIGNTRHSSKARQEAVDAFWFNYWGPLPLVADEDVGRAADEFAVALDEPTNEVPLRNSSMRLAVACRRALGFVGGDYSNVLPVAPGLNNDFGVISE